MGKEKINILEGIEKGISSSYLGRFLRIKNLDIESIQGVVMPSFGLYEQYPIKGAEQTKEYSVEKGFLPNELKLEKSLESIGWDDDTYITFSTTGTLPTGLNQNTFYKIEEIDSGWYFKVSYNGTIINITDAGTGTHKAEAVVMSNIIKFVQYSTNVCAIDSNGIIWKNSIIGIPKWKIISRHKKYSSIELADNKLIAPIISSVKVDTYSFLNNIWTEDKYTLDYPQGSYCDIYTMSNGITYVSTTNAVDAIEGDILTKSALTLPLSPIRKLLEYNNNLVLVVRNKIYFWDTFSPSYNSVIEIDGENIKTINKIGDLIYFTKDDSRNNWDRVIYATNGYSVQEVIKIPMTALDTQQKKHGKSVFIERNSSMVVGTKLFLGVSGQGQRSGDYYHTGIYTFDTKTGVINMPHEIDAQPEENTYQSRFYAMYPIDNFDFYISSKTTRNPTYFQMLGKLTYSDKYESTGYEISRSGSIETGIINIGDKYQTRGLRFFEIQLFNNLKEEQKIDLLYKNNSSEGYKLLGSMSYDDDGEISNKIIENSQIDCYNLMLKIIIYSPDEAVDIYNTKLIELKAVYIY